MDIEVIESNTPKKYADKFQEKYCDMLIRHMEEGFTFNSFAAKIGVATHTLFNWRKKYPEFQAAFDIGYAKGMYHWEQIGKAGITGMLKGFNGWAWFLIMRNRFGWNNKQESTLSLEFEQTPKGDGDIITTGNTVNIILPDNGKSKRD